jgi:hypothetical protein
MIIQRRVWSPEAAIKESKFLCLTFTMTSISTSQSFSWIGLKILTATLRPPCVPLYT